MKRFLVCLILFSFASTLFAAKIYRKDGSFTEMNRVESVFAQKINTFQIKKNESYLLNWKMGDKSVVIKEDGTGDLPVYSVEMNTFIADKYIFWRGSIDVDKISKKYGVELVEILPAYNLYKFKVTGDSLEIAQKIVEAGDGFAFPNTIRQLEYKADPVSVPIEDKYYKEGYQWSLKNTGEGITPQGSKMDILENADIRFEEAMIWILEKLGEDALPNFDETTKVAIMDSGVDPDHPDLKNKLDEGWDVVNDKVGGNHDEPTDPNNTGGYSHGTNCAGVSAAEGNDIGTTGVCPWCGIYPVHYMEGGAGGGTDEAGLLKVYQKYVDDPKIVAINCSFGPMAGFGQVGMSPGEEESHENFMKNGRDGKGGAIVYASGNDGLDVNYHALMGFEFKFDRDGEEVTNKVVVVGASSAWDTRVAYSNFGVEMDIIAPSLSMRPLIGIATSHLVGYGDLDDDYSNQFSGTSSAAPVITGALGVIFSVNSDLTLEEGITVLRDSADKINPETGFYDADGHSTKFGYGRVNLLKAVKLAAGVVICEESEKTDETDNNIDDNCDGNVDEGFAYDISTVGGPCDSDADCVTADFGEDLVECLTEYKIYKFSKGYCSIRNNNFACPDGTRTYGASQTDFNCLKDCNKDNECPEGNFCTEENLGMCFPACESDDDCSEDGYCDEGECSRNPSEPGGTCEESKDCLYGAMCITQVPEGFCLKQCQNGEDEMCGDVAKCAMLNIPQAGPMEICLPDCETKADCRSLMGTALECHKLISGKEDVCSMACSEDADCFDENAECSAGVCIPIGSSEDPDEDPDGEIDDSSTPNSEDDVIPDEEGADDSDDDSKKKDDGCSLIIL